jgi:uncharacterized protein (DUF1330 family)
MIEKVIEAFDAYQAAKDRFERSETTREIVESRQAVADARVAVMDAMDRWYEWKRLNGPRKAGG